MEPNRRKKPIVSALGVGVFVRRVCVDERGVTNELAKRHLTGLRVTLKKLSRLWPEPKRDGGGLADLSLGHKTSVAQLREAGYFSWGAGHWIHEDDEGTVMDEEWALADLKSRLA